MTNDAEDVAYLARTCDSLTHNNKLVFPADLYEVWVRAFDHSVDVPLRNVRYNLTGPLPEGDVERSGTTDGKGDLRERCLPCGEYLLKVEEGESVVAARCQEELGVEDGGRGTGSRTWPDAVRISGEQLKAEEASRDGKDEPGEAIPQEWSEEKGGWVLDFDPEGPLDEEGEGGDFDLVEEMDDEEAADKDEEELDYMEELDDVEELDDTDELSDEGELGD